VAAVLGRVGVERWDAPLIRLPDRGAVADYLIARFVARRTRPPPPSGWPRPSPSPSGGR